MGARHKLNEAFVNGALIVATIVGFLAESWLVFGLVFGGLFVLKLYSGDIRVNRQRRRRK
jgi:hypothetical protein